MDESHTLKMKIRINNQQIIKTPNLAHIHALASALARLAFSRLPPDVWGDITVTLTDDTGIQTYKEAAFGIREITDVVTIHYTPSPADPMHEGEIFVNVQRAFERQATTEWTCYHELALYIAHGFDHLTGANDHTPEKRKAMRQREKRWLKTDACRKAIDAIQTRN